MEIHFSFIYTIISTLFLANTIYSEDVFYSDNVIIGNLKRREVIPLAQINNPYSFKRRRFHNGITEANLKYRKTKDIREIRPVQRTFELTESQIREARIAENKENLDKLQNELRWLTIDTEDGIDQQSNMVYIGNQ